MAKVLIFGVGEIAEVAHIYLSHDTEHQIMGFTLDHDYRKQDYFRGLPVITFESITESYPPDEFKLFIPISFRELNQPRADKFKQAKSMGYQLISYVSSKALIMPETQIGENCFIFENNVIQPKVNIGDNTILWSGNHIGHHTSIGKHCFIASHAVISGHVSIGNYSFVGVNATIRDNICIAEKNVIGAGATLLHDTKPSEVYKGNKAVKAPITSEEIKW